MSPTQGVLAVLSCAGACLCACGSPGGGFTGGDAGTGPPPDAGRPPDARADADASQEAGPGKTCEGLPDGTPCGPAPNACHDVPECKAGACAPAKAKPDGTHWTPGDATAICCGGADAHSSDDTSCGVCGIQCNAANGESCQLLAGHYFCRGCVASASCWSGCCSTSFSPSSCAASDCAGNCCATCCPAGTHCVPGGGTSSNYCSY